MKAAAFDALLTEWLHRAQLERQKQRNDESTEALSFNQLQRATWLLGTAQAALIILFATVAGSQVNSDNEEKRPGTGTQGYNMFIGVEIMMFVGFGYLMTFMKWYGLGAVGWTMLIVALGLQWSLFTESFFEQLYDDSGKDWHYVQIDIYSLLSALYAISAVLISFGAVIGKISPYQLVAMTIIELALHSVNFKVLLEGCIGVVDMGGTYADHMFGAYFGLAVAYILGKPKSEPQMGNTPDIFSLIGTVFLWIYWPSFVAGAAEADSRQQERAIVNTILALASSTICAFWLSSVLSPHSKVRPVDIQNATLAGGVAIGCTANLTMSGFSAIMIGASAGLVSCFGYNILMPLLEHDLCVHDTCGVHNLHAMPSVVGGVASVILAGYKGTRGDGHDGVIYDTDHMTVQWGYQLLGIVVCISFAITTGLLTGLFLRSIGQNPKEFHDDCYWEVAEDYGRSFYTELAVILGQSGVAVDAIPDFSTHEGRRRNATAASFPRPISYVFGPSSHGRQSRPASIGLSISSEGVNHPNAIRPVSTTGSRVEGDSKHGIDNFIESPMV